MIDPAGVLLGLLQVMLLLNWPVAIIIIRAARHRPHIWALNVMAVMSTLVALAITAYVAVTANVAAGSPIDQSQLRVVLRLVLVGLALFPVLFLYLYWTGKFRDGHE